MTTQMKEQVRNKMELVEIYHSYESDSPLSFIECAKIAIYKINNPEKVSNSLREAHGRYCEATEQKYNHLTKRYEKF
jgi:hypothetical protein